MANGLTTQMKIFADEYLMDENGTRAYKVAYPNIKNDESAAACASKLIRVPKIEEYIKERQALLQKKLDVKREDVLRRYWELATTNVNDLVELRRICCRFCHGKDFKYQYTPNEMREKEKAYEAEVEYAFDNNKTVPEFDEKGGVGYDSRRDPNPNCPECFGEGIEKTFFKDSRKLKGGALDAYGGVRMTKDGGMELRINGREKALENVGRALGLFVEKIDVNVTGDIAVQLQKARERAKRAKGPTEDKPAEDD